MLRATSSLQKSKAGRLVVPPVGSRYSACELLTVQAERDIAVYVAATAPQQQGSASPPSFALIETSNSLCVPTVEQAMKETYQAPLESVEWIIVTHAHLDHCAGAGNFLVRCPKATVLCHPRAKRHLVDPSALLKSARQVYDEEAFKTNVGEMIPCPEERVRAVEDGELVMLHPDRPFRFFHTLGHAKHHVVAHDVACNAVFSGDNFGMSCDVIGFPQLFFPATAPIDFDANQAIATVDKILSLNPKFVFPTHYGLCDSPANAGEQVKKQLHAYERIRQDVLSMLKGAEPLSKDEEIVGNVTKRLLDGFAEHFAGVTGEHSTVVSQPGPVSDYIKRNLSLNAQGIVVGAKRGMQNKM